VSKNDSNENKQSVMVFTLLTSNSYSNEVFNK